MCDFLYQNLSAETWLQCKKKMPPSLTLCLLGIFFFCHLLIFYQNQLFFNWLSNCQTVWIQIRPYILSGLISVLTVCKSYQQTTRSRQWVKVYSTHQISFRLNIPKISKHSSLKCSSPKSAVCICSRYTFSACFLGSVDPGQTDPRGAVWSGSTLFIFLYAVGCSGRLYAYAHVMNYF